MSMFVLVFATLSAFAQSTIGEPKSLELSSPVYGDLETLVITQEAETTSAGSENSGEEGEKDPLVVLDLVIPRFPEISAINDQLLQVQLSMLTNNVGVLREDYLNRVVVAIDFIVAEYTNARFINSNDVRYANLDIYALVANTMANDNNVHLGIKYAERSLNHFYKEKPALLAQGLTNDVNQIEYHLNLYAAILNMYAGNSTSQKRSLTYFYHILDNPITQEGDDAAMYSRLNAYIASINNQLAVSEVNNDPQKRIYYNNTFDALWNIVESSDASEEVKEAKYFLLIRRYENILITSRPKFAATYQGYIKKMIVDGADAAANAPTTDGNSTDAKD